MKMVRITREVWKKDGDFYLTVTVIRRLAKHVEKKTGGVKRRRPKPRPESRPETETRPESRLPAVPDGALPSAWVFDDDARTVDLGGGQVMKLGRIQYGLLKYIAKGGTSTQEAWEKVWEFQSPAEWRTVRNTAMLLNEKLEECQKVIEIKVTTREVKFSVPENTEQNR